MTVRKEREALFKVLLAQAQGGGGATAAQAARQAASLGLNPGQSRTALELAARLDPLDSFSRLALSRLSAEAGELDAARREAAGVFKNSVDETARARAAFLLGELARARGDEAEARDAYAAVIRIEDGLLASDRADVTAARWYARAVGRLAELDARLYPERARTGAAGAVAMLHALTAQVGEPPALAADIADAEFRLGVLDLDADDPLSARKRLAEAIGRYEALAVVEPTEAHWRAVLAEAQALAAEAAFAVGGGDDARAAMDKALKLRIQLAVHDPQERWALCGLWRVRAALLEALGDHAGAADCLVQAVALARQLHAEAPANDETVARFVLHALLEQADLALRQRLPQAAADAAGEARALAEPFAQAAADPASEWRADLATAWDRIGEAARLGPQPTLAQDAFARAAALRRRAKEASRDDPHLRRALAAASLKHGDAALAAKAHRVARAAFSESFQLRLELAEAAPGQIEPARELATAMERMGLAAAAEGDAGAARAFWEEEMRLIEHAFEDPRDADGQRFRAVIEAHLASLGGPDAPNLRASALARLDVLAQDGALTERDTQLRRQLWQA